MKTLIVSLFGTYTPVTTEALYSYTVEGATYVDSYNVVASGAAGLDWPWIMGVLLFAICLWSFFRLVGLLLSR